MASKLANRLHLIEGRLLAKIDTKAARKAAVAIMQRVTLLSIHEMVQTADLRALPPLLLAYTEDDGTSLYRFLSERFPPEAICQPTLPWDSLCASVP